jgi:tetratricopeptide (TPR) repeat protein
MTRICTIAWLAVCICWAQQGVPWREKAAAIPGEPPAPAGRANFPQQDNRLGAIPIEIEPPPAPERPAGESVSVAQLQHKVPKEARRSFAHAIRLSKAEDHEGAAKELEATVRLDPEFADAYGRLGIEYGELKRPSDAATIFRRLLELTPDSVNGHCYLGLALLDLGDRGQSEEQIRLGLRQSPDSARCHFLLGFLLVQREATRADGLQHLQNAARTLQSAKKYLRSLR